MNCLSNLTTSDDAPGAELSNGRTHRRIGSPRCSDQNSREDNRSDAPNEAGLQSADANISQ